MSDAMDEVELKVVGEVVGIDIANESVEHDAVPISANSIAIFGIDDGHLGFG